MVLINRHKARDVIHLKNIFILPDNIAKINTIFKVSLGLMSKQMRASWETIRSVLGKSIVRVDSNDSQSFAWFDFQWKLIVGKDLALVTRVNKFSSKSLFVTVSDRIWFPALEPLREKIIKTINERAGSALVNRIVFQEGLIVESIKNNPSEEEKQYSVKQNKMQAPEIGMKDESVKNILDRINCKLKVILPVAILVFISNCTTFPIDQVSRNIDLSNSYAVKVVEKLSTSKSNANVRDPRAYYLSLIHI